MYIVELQPAPWISIKTWLYQIKRKKIKNQ